MGYIKCLFNLQKIENSHCVIELNVYSKYYSYYEYYYRKYLIRSDGGSQRNRLYFTRLAII